MTNRLINEASPYLLQHAENPVDWYPWGTEALGRARDEDKPVFLSIGYAACHWCHVMAHESFEDPAIAAVLNDGFVNIKVDREERPDLDGIYMQAVVAMTGQGGWPMSVWLTPEGVPFHAGTYFPPRPSHGLPSFRQVLEALAQAWRERRADIDDTTRRTLALLQVSGDATGAGPLGPDPGSSPAPSAAIQERLAIGFDRSSGGWGTAPKFPHPLALEFLARRHQDTGDGTALGMLEGTLTGMARGGMYDQLGGGFHRYATDREWLVPHFEKMLYDNALVSRAYLHAWQVTGNTFYRRIAEQTLDYVLREMQHPDGGFFSSQDADSEGTEGRFFVWNHREFVDAAGPDASLAARALGVTRGGNWEGANILYRAAEPRDLAREFRLTEQEAADRLAAARRRLWRHREERIKPGRDDKVLTAWNGLMLAALATAARALGHEGYLEAARKNAAFLLRESCTAEYRLRRVWTERGGSRLNGYLEDHAHLIEGLLTLYQATFEPRWFGAARGLADTMIDHFEDPSGGFWDTSDDHETLITRPRELQDNAVPSGNAMAATVLLQLHALTGTARYGEAAESALALVGRAPEQHPLGFGQWLLARDLQASGITAVALAGHPEDPATARLRRVLDRRFLPRVVAAGTATEGAGAGAGAAPPVPLLEGRTPVDGHTAAYVCRGFTCQRPVTEPGELAELLDAAP